MRAFRQRPAANLFAARPFQTSLSLMTLAILMAAVPARADLQLQRGFYVRAEEGCARASNATLVLLHKTGINGARSACDFTALTPAGQNTFRYTARCEEIGGPEPVEYSGTIEVSSITSFRQTSEDWQQVMTYCPQSSLPEPWATNDISDILN